MREGRVMEKGGEREEIDRLEMGKREKREER